MPVHLKFKALLSMSALAMIGASCAAPADAAVLRFTESATASGSLGGTAFNDVLVTLSGVTSTADVTQVYGSSLFEIVGVPVTVDVAGVGTAQFTDTIQLLSNAAGGVVGLGDVTTDFAVLLTLGAPSGNVLASSIGPLMGPAGYNRDVDFATSAGLFDFSSVSTSTFQQTVSTVPEPSGWAIMLVGVGALGARTRARRLSRPVETRAA